MEDVLRALRWLKIHGFDKQKLRIRTTDISKRPQNDADEHTYALFCNDVVQNISKGTQDAMRKNFFVDWARAGWIRRFDRDGIEVEEGVNAKRPSGIKFVMLTKEGAEFADETANIVDSYFKLSKGVDKLFSGLIQPMLFLVREEGLGYIDKHEFMFFVTAVGSGTTFAKTLSETASLIRAWRTLTPLVRMSITKELSKLLSPKLPSTSKIDKRDWGNWVNKAEQSFDILKNTIYFDLRPNDRDHCLDRLIFVADPTAEIQGNAAQKEAKRLVRSLAQKHEYFAKHSLDKRPGFELHHVVALTWAASQHQFKMFDNWKNMIYIDAYSHALITQNQNRNVWMLSPEVGVIELSDRSGVPVKIKAGETCLINLGLLPALLEYNRELISSVPDDFL